MPELPNTPVAVLPNEGDASFPNLDAIKVRDRVAPPAANRQPNSLRTRTVTTRAKMNEVIAVLNSIAAGAGDSEDFYLPRSGALAMLSDLDMDGNLIMNLADPVAAQDAATKAYVDATGRPNQYYHYAQDVISINAGGGGVQSDSSVFNFDPATGPGDTSLLLMPSYFEIDFQFNTLSNGTAPTAIATNYRRLRAYLDYLLPWGGADQYQYKWELLTFGSPLGPAITAPTINEDTGRFQTFGPNARSSIVSSNIIAFGGGSGVSDGADLVLEWNASTFDLTVQFNTDSTGLRAITRIISPYIDLVQ